MNKDQMQRFTPEQQETLATLEAERIKKVQELLEQARYYRGKLWLPPLVLAASLFACAVAANHQKLVPYLVGISLWFLIQFHAAGINRRLDALMELFRLERKENDREA